MNISTGWSNLLRDIQADMDCYNQNATALGGESASYNGPKLLLKNPGFQSMAAIRLMHFVKEAGVPKGGEVLSRLIRYLYGMEIHWNAKIERGSMIQYGPGLVISRSASIGPGCILCQHVTIGEMRDAKTKITGAPTLEKNVYIGPGSIVMGPITIGKGARINAGCVVTTSVPAHAVVLPPKSETVSRRN